MSRVISIFVAAFLLAPPVFAEKKVEKKSQQPETVIPLTNMQVDGKKVWLPKEIKAPKGKVKFVLNNTLEAPHGFQIPGQMKTGIVVPAQKTVEYEIDLKKTGRYELKCHMHPPHQSAFIDIY